MIDQNPIQEDLDEKVQVVEPENAVQEREPGAPRPGTQHLKNPVQVVNMYRRQFSQEAVDFGVEWQKSKGERGSAPMFMRADLPRMVDPGRKAFLHSRREKARTSSHRRRPKRNKKIMV